MKDAKTHIWERPLTNRQRALVGSMYKAMWLKAWQCTPRLLREGPRGDEAVEASFFEAFKSVARSAKRYTPERSKFTTYSYGMIGRQIAGYWSQQSNRDRVRLNPAVGRATASDAELAAIDAGTDGDHPAEARDRADRSAAVAAALLEWLDAANPRAATAVRLTFGIGRPPAAAAEIAAELGVVKQRVSQLVEVGQRWMRKRAKELRIDFPE